MEARPARPARFLNTQQLFVAIIPALIVASSITGFVWTHRDVTVIADGVKKHVTTQASDVAGALRDSGVAFADGDLVTPSLDSKIADGATVIVRRAIPVTLRVSGASVHLDVVGESVADALVAAGIDPSDNLGVEPGLSTALKPGLEIAVPRTVVRVVQAEVKLPFRTLTQKDPSRPRGSRSVVAKGSAGSALRIYRVLVTDGVEGPRTLTSQKVLQKPVDRIVAAGAAPSKAAVARRRAQAASAPRATSSARQLRVSATAYAPGSDGVDWRTATGGRAGYGVIAVDPKVIPLGTRLFIPGYGYGIASDTGGAIDGTRIDLCFETRAEAMLWGRRSVTITVLR
jgi:uncharacterized protein YabE (DUF348 family)